MKHIAKLELTVKSTTQIQTDSLVNFAAGIGYEAMFDIKGRLRSFRAPQFDKSGDGRIGVMTMIKWHNDGPRQALRQLHTFHSFRSLMNSERYDANRLTALVFAGTLNLVERVRGQSSRREGLMIQSGNIEFVNSGAFFQSVKTLEKNQ